MQQRNTFTLRGHDASATQPGRDETIYTTYNRIDGIATPFETCMIRGTLSDHIPTHHAASFRPSRTAIQTTTVYTGSSPTSPAIAALESHQRRRSPYTPGGTTTWPTKTMYLARAPWLWRWSHTPHLICRFLVEIETTEDHRNDYFVLGELMIEITPDFIQDSPDFYDTDTEDFLTKFMVGDCVDEIWGEDTTITFSYQTIRTKSWNNACTSSSGGVDRLLTARSTPPSGASTAYSRPWTRPGRSESTRGLLPAHHHAY